MSKYETKVYDYNICELIKQVEELTEDKDVLNLLDDITYQANRMKSRLKAYRESIEKLGFERKGE